MRSSGSPVQCSFDTFVCMFVCHLSFSFVLCVFGCFVLVLCLSNIVFLFVCFGVWDVRLVCSVVFVCACLSYVVFCI